MKAVLIRQRQLSNEKQTCGRFVMIDDNGEIAFHCVSLELPWRGNQPNVSCIPVGDYLVGSATSPKFGKGTMRLTGVPGRSHILIHPGNFTHEIEGCILLGERFSDIDNDDITDVVNSKTTIEKVKKLAASFELKIIQI